MVLFFSIPWICLLSKRLFLMISFCVETRIRGFIIWIRIHMTCWIEIIAWIKRKVSSVCLPSCLFLLSSMSLDPFPYACLLNSLYLDNTSLSEGSIERYNRRSAKPYSSHTLHFLTLSNRHNEQYDSALIFIAFFSILWISRIRSHSTISHVCALVLQIVSW